MTLPRRLAGPIVAYLITVGCGGDAATTTGNADGNHAPPSTIHLYDTLTRTLPANRHDTLTLTADRVLRVRFDLRQSVEGGVGLLRFDVIDPTTFVTVAAGQALPASTPLGSDAGGSGAGWSVLPHAGTYLVIVSVFNNAAYAGTYQIRLIGSDPAPEHAPARLAFGDSVVESIDAPGDVDEFTLVGLKGPTLARVFLKAETSVASDTMIVDLINVAIGDPTLAASPGNDASTFGASKYVDLRNFDSVRVRVRAASTATRGSYRLKWIHFDEAPEGTSATLVAGDTVTSSLESPGDVDTFTFKGVPGKLYALAAQVTSGRASDSLHFDLHSASSSPFDAHIGTTPRLLDQMSARFSGDTTMTLRVSGDRDGAAYGSYRIVIVPIDPGPEHAPAVLAYGDTITESIDVRADFDEYTIAAQPGDTVILYAQALTPDTTQVLVVTTTGFTFPPLSANGSPRTGASPVFGSPLRASYAGPMIVPTTGPYKITVYGSSRTGTNTYVGQYRLVVARISNAPESSSRILQPNVIVTETGDPPGELDRFIVQAPPGQDIAIYTAPVTKGAGTANFIVWNGTTPRQGLSSDSLGWIATFPRTFPAASQYIDVEPVGTNGLSFPYRVWLYAVDRRPEHVSATVHFGDVVTGEDLYPVADVDEFTLAAPAGAHFQACILNREPSSTTQQIDLTVSTANGVVSSRYGDAQPQCSSTQTTPATGAVTLQVTTSGQVGGRFELRVVSVP